MLKERKLLDLTGKGDYMGKQKIGKHRLLYTISWTDEAGLMTHTKVVSDLYPEDFKELLKKILTESKEKEIISLSEHMEYLFHKLLKSGCDIVIDSTEYVVDDYRPLPNSIQLYESRTKIVHIWGD